MSYAPVDIPELRLEVLEKFITKFTAPPELVFTPMLADVSAESDTIKWESYRGSRGLAPFTAVGSPSHVIAPSGVAENSAMAAFMSEKIPFTEQWINNMRKAGTVQQYEAAKAKMAKEYAKLVNRNRRRKEWMIAKMFCDGGFDYSEESGTKLNVDYQIPAENRVALSGNERWGESDADILGNIMDAKTVIKQANNGKIDMMVINTSVLKLMAADPQITALLRKDAFGDGTLYSGAVNNLVGVNPNVLAGLLDIPKIVIYDEAYEVRSYFTAPVLGGSTTEVVVESAIDFEVGGSVQLFNTRTGKYDNRTIAAVNYEASTVTLDSAPTNTYQAGTDYLRMTKMFVPDNKAVFMTKQVDGEPIAEWMNAPYGIPRGYGMKPKAWMEVDPDVAWVRIQNKGLPVLFYRDALYHLQVR